MDPSFERGNDLVAKNATTFDRPSATLRAMVLCWMRQIDGRASLRHEGDPPQPGDMHPNPGVAILYEPYDLDAPIDDWDLFNQSLRPVSQPQPELAIPPTSLAQRRQAAALHRAMEHCEGLKESEAQRSTFEEFLTTYENVRQIARRARSGDDPAAVEALASIAHYAAEQLEAVPRDTVRPIARHHPSWPVIFSPLATSITKAVSYLDELETGAACPLNVKKSARWNEEVVVTRHALKLRATVEFNRALYPILMDAIGEKASGSKDKMTREVSFPSWVVAAGKLKAFSAETCPEWWKVALAAFKEACPNPHRHVQFTSVAQGEVPAKRPAAIREAIRGSFFSLPPKTGS